MNGEDMTFESPSAFSIFLKRMVNPNRKADDGWKTVKFNGRFLEVYKLELARRRAAGALISLLICAVIYGQTFFPHLTECMLEAPCNQAESPDEYGVDLVNHCSTGEGGAGNDAEDTPLAKKARLEGSAGASSGAKPRASAAWPKIAAAGPQNGHSGPKRSQVSVLHCLSG